MADAMKKDALEFGRVLLNTYCHLCKSAYNSLHDGIDNSYAKQIRQINYMLYRTSARNMAERLGDKDFLEKCKNCEYAHVGE